MMKRAIANTCDVAPDAWVVRTTMPQTAQATPSTAMGQRITCSIDLSFSRRGSVGP